MSEEVIRAIESALKNGFRIEILMDKDGRIIIQTIKRKLLKTQ